MLPLPRLRRARASPEGLTTCGEWLPSGVSERIVNESFRMLAEGHRSRYLPIKVVANRLVRYWRASLMQKWTLQVNKYYRLRHPQERGRDGRILSETRVGSISTSIWVHVTIDRRLQRLRPLSSRLDWMHHRPSDLLRIRLRRPHLLRSHSPSFRNRPMEPCP